MKTLIIEGIKLTCSDCNSEFRWVPTSTIKPVRCYACQKLKDFMRIQENQKLLKKASFYDRTGKNTTKAELPIKAINNAKKRLDFVKKRKTWQDKPLPNLLRHVQFEFCNKYIRERDIELFGKCISCNGRITQAGHRFSVGDFPGMRLMVNNIHGQEVSCNHHKSGNIDAFDRGLIHRHGEKYLEELKKASDRYLAGGFKWNRFDVIEIGETYQYLLKKRIWVFSMESFNEFRDKLRIVSK